MPLSRRYEGSTFAFEQVHHSRPNMVQGAPTARDMNEALQEYNRYEANQRNEDNTQGNLHRATAVQDPDSDILVVSRSFSKTC